MMTMTHRNVARGTADAASELGAARPVIGSPVPFIPMADADAVVPEVPPEKRGSSPAVTLNTHVKASLYQAFPAAEACRLVERFEWHYTPKHGSWLDLAESELAVLTSQCLDRRIPDKQTLTKEVAAWGRHRNSRNAKADWHSTIDTACVKLKHLYPVL